MSAANATTHGIPPSHPDHFAGSPYHYVPTLYVCAIFIALFGLSGLLHLAQALYCRLWFMLPTAVLACIAEVIGWAARLWSSKNPSLLDPFLIQITTTIIAPTPLVAANFVILGQLIVRLGSQYSRLNAMWYTIVFCSCDIIALVIQAVGGAAASKAVHQDKNPNKGGNIMLGGIVFQLVSITVYSALATEFILRYLADRPLRSRAAKVDVDVGPRFLDKKTKLMLVGLSFSSVTLFIRSVYRTIELSDGWDGRVISTQVYFNVLDGAMITLATFTMNAFHPGWLLGPGRTWTREKRADAASHRSGSLDNDTVTDMPNPNPKATSEKLAAEP